MDSNIGSIPCDVCGKPVAAHGNPQHDRVEVLPCHNCERDVRVELLDVDGWCPTCIDAMGADE